ncbi:Transcriptional regulator, AraC family [hydrothermal vent metagenome]|uniref:Transcriptional regulator, AraC family n=1 Tax=hydrothermal vent metagenome TaxID=652676 RepID=A0A3B0TZ42_9ZZZZ
MRSWPIRDFAKTSLFNLIVHQIARTDPELLPATATVVDAVRQAQISAAHKREILDFVWRRAGPEKLLSIGQDIGEVGYDPIWHAAVRSVSPAVFFDKWQRFEVFAHSNNRLRIDQSCQNQASFHRYTVDGGTPTPPENLLICGLTIAILEEIGCHGLRCQMTLDDGTAHHIRRDGRFFIPDDGQGMKTGAWTIRWRRFSPRDRMTASVGDIPGFTSRRLCDSVAGNSIEPVVRLLMSDVGRQWKVGELAGEAGLSTRSLQRRLTEAGLNFSRLVRLVRIHEACHLLKDSEAPITAIGFCAGFEDSSQFSRDFRATVGMTPSNYRTVLGSG